MDDVDEMGNSRETSVRPVVNHFVYTHLELFLWAHEYWAVVEKQPCRAARGHVCIRRGVKNRTCNARDGGQRDASEKEFDRKRNNGGIFLDVEGGQAKKRR